MGLPWAASNRTATSSCSLGRPWHGTCICSAGASLGNRSAKSPSNVVLVPVISNVFKPLLRSGHIAHHLFCSEVCAHLSTYKPGEFFRVSFPQHQFVQQSTLPTHFYLSLQTEICRFRFYSVLIAQNAAVFFLQRISTTNS